MNAGISGIQKIGQGNGAVADGGRHFIQNGSTKTPGTLKLVTGDALVGLIGLVCLVVNLGLLIGVWLIHGVIRLGHIRIQQRFQHGIVHIVVGVILFKAGDALYLFFVGSGGKAGHFGQQLPWLG